MKWFLQRILQEIMNKKNTWNIRHLVDESFVPATQQPSVLYWRLSDFRTGDMGQPNILVPLIKRGRHRVESGNIIPGDLKKKVFYPPTKQLAAWPLQSVEAMHTESFSKKNAKMGLPPFLVSKSFKLFLMTFFWLNCLDLFYHIVLY